MNSTLFSLSTKDGLKGLILAVGTPVVYVLQQLAPSWTPWLTLHFGATLAVILQTSISALIAYLIKNFFTDSVGAATSELAAQAKKQNVDTTMTITPTGVSSTTVPATPIVSKP